MALLNPRFLLPGEHPGEAEHWTLVTHTTIERIAGFGPEPHSSVEDFERWFALRRCLEDVQIAIALFDPLPEAVEDFEDAWLNDFYYFELPTGRIIWCSFGDQPVDDMETGWQNDLFAWDWEDVSSVNAIFNGEPFENFETNWRGNEDYLWVWEEVPSIVARFDEGINTAEDFEGDWEEPEEPSP